MPVMRSNAKLFVYSTNSLKSAYQFMSSHINQARSEKKSFNLIKI